MEGSMAGRDQRNPKDKEEKPEKTPSMVIRNATWHNGLLTIEFTMSPPRSYDGIWAYSGVPREVFEDFMDAESRGGFFNAYIRGKYNFTKIK